MQFAQSWSVRLPYSIFAILKILCILYQIVMTFRSVQQEGIVNEKLRALLGLYVLQSMVGISEALNFHFEYSLFLFLLQLENVFVFDCIQSSLSPL
jgi:hypothetical protein